MLDTSADINSQEGNLPPGIILICGPPASGKTTLARSLHRTLDSSVVFSFDDIFSLEEQDAAIKTKGDFRRLRRTLLEGVEDLLDDRRESSAARRLLSVVRNAMGNEPGARNERESWQHVIIDDNLYLRSMRYCWLQAARLRGLALCIVYVTAQLDECLTRNRRRSVPVANDIIIEQFRKMEPPLPDKHTWERFSMTIDTSDTSLLTRSLEAIGELISAARMCPFQPVDIETALQEADTSRRETQLSKSHNLDLAFRRAIASLVNGEKQNDRKQAIWVQANSRKAEVLARPEVLSLSSKLLEEVDQRTEITERLQETITALLNS